MRSACINPKSRIRHSRSGITVLELLVVISIIVLLSAVAIPALKGFGRSNTMASANRQLLDDFALARQRAINEHSVVRVIFVPTYDDLMMNFKFSTTSERDRKVFTNIWTGGQIRYALYAERSAGDQPGRHNGRYLTGWRSLPDGVFIPEWQLTQLLMDPAKVPFPTSDGLVNDLPHISFDDSGGVIRGNGLRKPEGEYLHLARGSVMFQRDNSGKVLSYDARENPVGNSTNNFNRVRIDGLTGRCRIERPEIK
jgi:type II secretory pathway pseudopilin PulG